MALAGIPNNLNGIASTAIWGDSIDYMEWKTGHRSEGSVFALQNLVAKIGTALSTFTTGLTLTIMKFDATKYDQGLPQDPLFYKLIWPFFMLAPALGSVFYYARRHRAELEAEASPAGNVLDMPIY